jgi:hypothetical protein
MIRSTHAMLAVLLVVAPLASAQAPTGDGPPRREQRERRPDRRPAERDAVPDRAPGDRDPLMPREDRPPPRDERPPALPQPKDRDALPRGWRVDPRGQSPQGRQDEARHPPRDFRPRERDMGDRERWAHPGHEVRRQFIRRAVRARIHELRELRAQRFGPRGFEGRAPGMQGPMFRERGFEPGMGRPPFPGPRFQRPGVERPGFDARGPNHDDQRFGGPPSSRGGQDPAFRGRGLPGRGFQDQDSPDGPRGIEGRNLPLRRPFRGPGGPL